MKKTTMLILALVGALAGVLFYHSTPGQRFAYQVSHSLRLARVSASAQVPEFTLVIKGTVLEPGDDQPRVASRIIKAARKDGSTVEIKRTYPKRWINWVPQPQDDNVYQDDVQVFDMQSRRSIRAFPGIKGISSIPITDTVAENRRNAKQAANCVDDRTGHVVKRYGTVKNFGAVEVGLHDGSTMWVLPAFGCEAVEYDHLDKDKGTLNRNVLESVLIGPPDPKLFQVEGEELSPSELHRKWNEHIHVPYGPNELANDTPSDRKYKAARLPPPGK